MSTSFPFLARSAIRFADCKEGKRKIYRGKEKLIFTCDGNLRLKKDPLFGARPCAEMYTIAVETDP